VVVLRWKPVFIGSLCRRQRDDQYAFSCSLHNSQAKEEDLKQQQQSTVELLQQNKEAELKLLAAEHLAALRAKDAELLEAI
jgi:hypothetical protein